MGFVINRVERRQTEFHTVTLCLCKRGITQYIQFISIPVQRNAALPRRIPTGWRNQWRPVIITVQQGNGYTLLRQADNAPVIDRSRPEGIFPLAGIPMPIQFFRRNARTFHPQTEHIRCIGKGDMQIDFGFLIIRADRLKMELDHSIKPDLSADTKANRLIPGTIGNAP